MKSGTINLKESDAHLGVYDWRLDCKAGFESPYQKYSFRLSRMDGIITNASTPIAIKETKNLIRIDFIST